jgi:beta-lactamase-like protein
MDNLNIQYIERFAVQLVGYKIWAIDEFAIAQCYLIEGDTQAVLIDTGLGQGDLRSVVDRLTDKPYIIINTHGHSDHIGGNDEFSDHSIYMHMQDDCISHLENLSEEERLKSFKKSFNEPGFYGKKEYDMSRQYRKFTYSNVCEGQVFDLGGRTLEVIATPGHTRGSIVLFDKEDRCLFSGDTVVSTPILIFNGLNSTTVEEFHKSLCKLKQLREKIDLIYPGHYLRPIGTTYIDELWELSRMICSGEASNSAFDLSHMTSEKTVISQYRQSSIAYTVDCIFERE